MKNILLRNAKNFIVAVVLCVKNITKTEIILQKKHNELGSNKNIIYCFRYLLCARYFLFIIQTYTQIHFGMGSDILNKQKHLSVVICLLQAGRGASGVDGDQKTADSCQ